MAASKAMLTHDVCPPVTPEALHTYRIEITVRRDEEDEPLCAVSVSRTGPTFLSISKEAAAGLADLYGQVSAVVPQIETDSIEDEE